MLSTLYKLSPATDKVQQWSIEAIGSSVVSTSGQVGGKLTVSSVEALPKNLGRANATTAEQQALAECTSKHSKKLKSGYTTDPSGKQTTLTPMKVNVYQDHTSKVTFPAELQFKLNGVNATYRLIDDELILTSRGNEVYAPIPHLEYRIRTIMNQLNTTCLAGELYIYGTALQTITSYVKKPKPGSELLEFRIFDLPDSSLIRSERSALMEPIPESIASTVVNSHVDIERLQKVAVDNGYEGVVIYNNSGLYKYNTRSLDVLKFKVALDSEHLVTDFSIDKLGHPVFVLQVSPSNLATFKCKLKGTAEQRLAMADIASSFIGRFLNIEYESHSLAGIPTKPVGQYFRECNPITWQPLA